MEIVRADIKELATIKELAYQIWPNTYGNILSKEQLAYMLDKFYSEENLERNVTLLNHEFYLVKYQEQFIGFFSTELNYQEKPTTRIHKIYLKPETQGKGIGRKIIDFVEDLAKANQNNALSLNVNRFNNAKDFYKKVGFKVILQEDIVLEHGYLMEDYLMEKSFT